MPRELSSITELAVLLIGTDERRSQYRDRVWQLLDQCDPSALADYLQRLGVLTFAVRTLTALDPDRVPSSLEKRSGQFAAVVGEGNQIISSVSAVIRSELESAEIPALELKGSRLAQRLHGGLRARVSTDIDILVAARHLDRAIAVCESFGFEQAAPDVSRGLPSLHARLIHRPGFLPPVELHWRIHWYETEFAAAMLGRSTIVDGVRQPTVEDEVAALLLYYARDGFVGLRYPNDLAAWHARFSTVARPDGLERLCAAHPDLAISWVAASEMCERIVGARVGGLQRPGSGRSRLAIRFADWDFIDSKEQRSANTLAIDAICSPRAARGAWIRRALFPPAEAVTHTSAAADSRLGLYRQLALHPIKMISRIGYATAVVLLRGRFRPLPTTMASEVLASTSL